MYDWRGVLILLSKYPVIYLLSSIIFINDVAFKVVQLCISLEDIVTAYLDNDLLFNAVSTVNPLNDMVRATVLNNCISYFDFPFEHADHKLSIKKELSTTI